MIHNEYLQYEVLLRLQPQLTDGLAHGVLQLRVSLPGHVQLGEQVADQPQEDGHVAGHYLRQVEVPQSPHQHLGAGGRGGGGEKLVVVFLYELSIILFTLCAGTFPL